ncbi:MAG TPA: mycofactocin-coupled SDR family oxidoreductase [Pseudolysinimonas sp.]|nr:mycofactocin-coupled SDR family oxidoreductase [Pseudolysinimonas sp.]
MGKLEGKVAFITGAARGQGRSHAIRLAREGADIIAIDIAEDISSLRYSLATPDDLTETVRLVEAEGRSIHSAVADVRDFDAVRNALDAGVSRFGRLDVVVANAGIMGSGRAEELTGDAWKDMIDTNLTGVWHTAKAAIPHLRATGGGGSMILTSSTYGAMGAQNVAHYVAAKHGVIGLMRGLALELASESIRVNTVAPTVVNTPMVQNESIFALFAPELAPEERTTDVIWPRFAGLNSLPVPWVEPKDVSAAVLWLASDESRYVTGINLPIDAGALLK